MEGQPLYERVDLTKDRKMAKVVTLAAALVVPIGGELSDGYIRKELMNKLMEEIVHFTEFEIATDGISLTVQYMAKIDVGIEKGNIVGD